LERKGLFNLFKIASGINYGGLDVLFGFGGLVKSIFSVTKLCGQSKTDCVFGALDILADFFTDVYSWSNLRKRTVDGVTVFGSHTLSSGTTINSHIPVTNGTSFYHALTAMPNDGSFQHVASAVLPNGTAKHIWYRVASAQDLGRENDGSYNHVRVASPTYNQTSSEKRKETNDDGVVADYLWNNNNEQMWDSVSGVAGDTMGSMAANYMEENELIASCWVPILNGPATGNQDWGADHGVVAFGWNNQPFDFDGRSGGWLDECAEATE
jgi:hypothetical protein